MSRDTWEPMSEVTPYLNSGIYVWLLYSFPSGERPVLGCHRKGRFFGREVDGWWGTEKIGTFGRPSHGMWIDGWIKGWKRYCDHTPEEHAHD